jgi:type I restriction enzyme S subunit
VWSRLPDLLAIGNSLRRGPFGSSITKSMFVPKSDSATKVYEQKNAIYKNYSLGSYYINLNQHPNLKTFIVGPGDIIISCAGTIGETYILPNEASNGIINQALLKIQVKFGQPCSLKLWHLPLQMIHQIMPLNVYFHVQYTTMH